MINRYSRPEMANIWSEENKYRAWLEVEILADEAWAELGEIPKEESLPLAKPCTYFPQSKCSPFQGENNG